jgi:hypothetical protein
MARTERELAQLFARLSEVYAERATIMGKLTGTNMATGRKVPARHAPVLPIVSAADAENASVALRALNERRASRRRA